MTSNNVLVFGPTGGVGCATAVEAHRRGAKVWLAMRDTKKEIKGLKEDECYARVQADLSQPETLQHAVEQSGATTAFVYTMLASQDSMQGSFEALKEAGITYIVILSSFVVKGAPRDEGNQADFIKAAHSKTEAALMDVGIPFTAVRPAFFSTNIYWYIEEMKKGEVSLLYPGVEFDYITPDDIGAVAGAFLAEQRFRDEGVTSVVLCGPELLPQREAIATVGRVLGREIAVKELDEESWFKKMGHMPRPVLESIAKNLRKSNAGESSYPKEMYGPAVENIRKYAEREPMKFADWAEANEEAFA